MRPLLYTNAKDEIAIRQLFQGQIYNKYLVDIIWNYAIEFELQLEFQTLYLNRKNFNRFQAIQYCLDLEYALCTICEKHRDFRSAKIVQQGRGFFHDLSTQKTPILTQTDITYLSDDIIKHIDDGEYFNLNVHHVYYKEDAAEKRNMLKKLQIQDELVLFSKNQDTNITLYYKLIYFKHEYMWRVVAFIYDDPLFFAETYS